MCFLVGATGEGITQDGQALLGSTSDDPYDVRTFVKFVSHQTEASASIPFHVGTELEAITGKSLAERGYFSRDGVTTRGVNSSGLSFTCALAVENAKEVQRLKQQQASLNLPRPTSFHDITSAMMRNCSTVAQAIELFQLSSSVEPSFTILIADSLGNLAWLEAGHFGVSVVKQLSRKDGGIIYAVNCYQSSALKAFNDPSSSLDNTDNNNQCRISSAVQTVRDLQAHNGLLGVQSFTKILANHRYAERPPSDNPILNDWGYSICNHGTRSQQSITSQKRRDEPKTSNDAKDLPWGTVSAEVLQPSTQTLWYCYGWACGGDYDGPFLGLHDDQPHQERSWKQFEGFSSEHLPALKKNDVSFVNGEQVVRLTTLDGFHRS